MDKDYMELIDVNDCISDDMINTIKTQMKSLTVEMMLGVAVVTELLDLVDAKIYLLLCIRLLLAKDKASDQHNAITV